MRPMRRRTTATLTRSRDITSRAAGLNSASASVAACVKRCRKMSIGCSNRRRRDEPAKLPDGRSRKAPRIDARSVAATSRSTTPRAHGANPSSGDGVNCFVTQSKSSLQAAKAAADRFSRKLTAATSPVRPKNTGFKSFATRRRSLSNELSQPAMSCIVPKTTCRVRSATAPATFASKRRSAAIAGACSSAQHSKAWRWAKASASPRGFGRARGTPILAMSATTSWMMRIVSCLAAGAQ
mmetsp:Transcript_34952/g.107871  ORF Transcript_34952/g.107871 Transcript_34952/m.107871 type:complete len:239 (-) Transcript_34952:233-949(-)